jgi:hypothetical protein
MKSEAPPTKREESEEEEDTVSKNPENSVDQKVPVGFNGKMALDMLSKKKKKQLRRELDADQKAEEELKQRILQKKAEDAREADRVRREFDRQERAELKKEKDALKKAAELAQKEKEEAEAAQKDKKDKKQAKKSAKKVEDNLAKESDPLNLLQTQKPQTATFGGGAATR